MTQEERNTEIKYLETKLKRWTDFKPKTNLDSLERLNNIAECKKKLEYLSTIKTQ